MENDSKALRTAPQAPTAADPRAELLQVLESWIRGDREARVITKRSAEVLWANTAAESLQQTRSAFFVAGGVLEARRPAATRRLREFLADVGPRHHILEEGGTVLWARQIGPTSDALGVTIRGAAEPPDFTALGGIRNLTPAERRILDMILAGDGTEHIADQLQISIQTARSHVKRAYRKLGVTSRGELFVKALPFLHP